MASQTHHGSPKQNPSIRRPKGYIRQSLSRLSRLITLRRTGGLSHRCQSLILDDPDTTKLSENSLEKLTDAQSITTCASVSTWGIEDAASSQKEQLPSSIVSTSSDNLLPMLVGGKQAKVALSPSLHKSGAEIESIEIEFRDGQRISWRRPRNIMDLPEMVRKDIWRKVVVDDRRLMVCDC